MIFWICFCVGLAAILLTVRFLRSTLKSGAGSLAGFRENLEFYSRPMTVPIGDTIETRRVYLNTLELITVSLRAIPQSHFAKLPTVEPSQSVSSANSGEANA